MFYINAQMGQPKEIFLANRKHLIEGKDYFKVHREGENPNQQNSLNEKESSAQFINWFPDEKPNGRNSSIGTNVDTRPFHTLPFSIPPKGITLLTESGYLMLVKSFTDKLAWDVQRELVKTYFKAKDNLPVPLKRPSLPEKPKEEYLLVSSNAKFQNAKKSIKESMSALNCLLRLVDVQTPSLKDYKRITGTAWEIATDMLLKTGALRDMEFDTTHKYVAALPPAIV